MGEKVNTNTEGKLKKICVMKGAIIFLVSVLLLQTAPASPVTPAAGKEAEEEDVDDEYYDYDDTTDEARSRSQSQSRNVGSKVSMF